MIDDLFTDLAVGSLDRLLSTEMSREEADFGLARLSARLSLPVLSDQVKPGRDAPADLDSGLERRLISQYLQLPVDDLQQISPRVHEWILDRLSQLSAWRETSGAAETLRKLYFLFPESTVRHAVIGLLVQDRTDVVAISDAIRGDAGLSPEDRVYQIRVFSELLLDYVDDFPDATERALTALYEVDGDEPLRTHLINWANRLGGEAGARVQRAVKRSDTRG